MRKNRTKFYNPDRSTLIKQPTQLIAMPLTGQSAIILKENKRFLSKRTDSSQTTSSIHWLLWVFFPQFLFLQKKKKKRLLFGWCYIRPAELTISKKGQLWKWHRSLQSRSQVYTLLLFYIELHVFEATSYAPSLKFSKRMPMTHIHIFWHNVYESITHIFCF